MRMGRMFFRIIEITFASYMVPALLVPMVWVAAWLMKRRLRTHAHPATEVEGQSRLLFWLFLVWFLLFLAVIAGVPFNRGGSLAVVSCWIVYAATNLLLAWFLLRFTTTYGSIPDGRAAYRGFLLFIAIIAT